MTDIDPMFSDASNAPPCQRELVSAIVLRFKNGEALRIAPWIDYCTVTCVNEIDEAMTIAFSELKEGLCNWEDLHPEDETLQGR